MSASKHINLRKIEVPVTSAQFVLHPHVFAKKGDSFMRSRTIKKRVLKDVKKVQGILKHRPLEVMRAGAGEYFVIGEFGTAKLLGKLQDVLAQNLTVSLLIYPPQLSNDFIEEKVEAELDLYYA